MLKVVWQNRDNLNYAWKVLSRGVCDGCALGVAGFHDWTMDGVHLCMTRLNLLRLNTMPAMGHDELKSVAALKILRNDELRALGRLAYPMLREGAEPGFRRISWDEAKARIGRRLRNTAPERMGFFLTSRGITNETYYVAQKVARFLGTNNIDNAARLCHSPSTAAMKQALGVAASTCSYIDFWDANLIVFFGSNPANDQPVSIKYLVEAKKRGAKVILVNPYLEPGMQRYWVPSTPGSAVFGSDIADTWFPVSQGGDIAFLYGTLKALFEMNGQNHAFINAHTHGFDAIRQRAESLDWQTLENAAGLPQSAMRDFAILLASADRAILVWSMGITQHVFGADAVSLIIDVALARGFVGKKGCGLMPIRGHSSVQAGAEMGAYATAFPGGVAVNAVNAAILAAQYGFPIPSGPGLSAVDMIDASASGHLDLLYCLGGNFMSTLPEPVYASPLLRNCPLCAARLYSNAAVTWRTPPSSAGRH